MAYTKHTWSSGDVLTAAQMNALSEGTEQATNKIINSSAIDSSGHLVLTFEDESTMDCGLVKGDTGYTPVKGTDYWTEDDKAEIIVEVLAALGNPSVFGTVDENNNITLSGSLENGAYTLKYEMDDGTTVGIGTLQVGEKPVAHTNLFDANAAALNSRWSNSSASYTTTNGYVVSDFIPVSISSDEDNPTVFRFRGGTMADSGGIYYYDANKEIIADSIISSVGYGCSAGYMAVTTDENGDYQTNLGYRKGAFVSDWADTAYIKVCLQINSTSTAITQSDIEDIIMTIDEPIED